MPRALSQRRDSSLPSDPTFPSGISASSPGLITVSVCPPILCLPPQLSTCLCPPASVSLHLPAFASPFLCIYLAVSLSINASLSVTLSPPSHSLVLFLFSGLLPLGVCSGPTGQPPGTSGLCPGSPSRSPPRARHLGADSAFPLQQWGVEGALAREDTVPGICSGAPGPLTPLCPLLRAPGPEALR